MRSIPGPFKRGFVAASLAAAIVTIVIAIAAMPALPLPSNPRWRMSMLLAPALGAPFVALLIALWVLPVCLTIQWVMERRRVRGTSGVLVVAAFASLGVTATLLIPEVTTGVWDVRALIGRVQWLAILGTAFVWIWFFGYAQLSPRAEADAPHTRRSLRHLAFRTTTETLALVGVFAWAALVGRIVGADHS